VIFVDTSVWVDYFRGRDMAVRAILDRLLDDDLVALAVPVRIELLGGARKEQQRTLVRLLSALPTFPPSEGIWARMERWVLAAGRAGFHFGVGDLLVGAIAVENEGAVWSLDSDITDLQKLGFIKLYAPS
jgi:predicted nucleic acid-binding protein